MKTEQKRTSQKIEVLQEKVLGINTIKNEQARTLMIQNTLLDKVFDGKPVMIEGRKYYSKPKLFENETYKIFYRKKANKTFVDVVIISKGKNAVTLCDYLTIEDNKMEMKGNVQLKTK
ncbi:MAG: hypothetical protein HRT89_13800 [Lentisphaeria bacterium]|nr:hypothetical protein [Lentisphaeria bacterium]NQZ69130.1 hypothetical protein [Lentisphaeria bacterium]